MRSIVDTATLKKSKLMPRRKSHAAVWILDEISLVSELWNIYQLPSHVVEASTVGHLSSEKYQH